MKREEQEMKKTWMILVAMMFTVVSMMGITVIVLANSPVLSPQNVTGIAIDSTRAVIAAIFAVICGILAFVKRHSR